jgi:hypothetical protein
MDRFFRTMDRRHQSAGASRVLLAFRYQKDRTAVCVSSNCLRNERPDSLCLLGASYSSCSCHSLEGHLFVSFPVLPNSDKYPEPINCSVSLRAPLSFRVFCSCLCALSPKDISEGLKASGLNRWKRLIKPVFLEKTPTYRRRLREFLLRRTARIL